MAKKTPDEFKAAFKAIKKPKRPADVSAKDKSSLEKVVSDTKDWDDKRFIDLAAKLYAKNPDYMVDLIAYKFAKHFDEASKKKPFSFQNFPTAASDNAL